MNKIREHYCGFIPGDGSEKMKLLYCCPDVGDVPKTSFYDDESTEAEPSNDVNFSSRSAFKDECMTTDEKAGNCVHHKSCTSAVRIIDNDLQDLFHLVRRNKCGLKKDRKVCCALEEILDENQCFNDKMEKGECQHYSECSQLLTARRVHREDKTKFSKDEKLFWNRSKCQPKGAATMKFKTTVSRKLETETLIELTLIEKFTEGKKSIFLLPR